MNDKEIIKGIFSLIDLIVVISILAILALILVPSITNYIAKANESKNIANTRMLYNEMVLLKLEDEMDHNAILERLKGLISDGDKVQINPEINEVRYVPKTGKVVFYDGYQLTLTNKAATDYD